MAPWPWDEWAKVMATQVPVGLMVIPVANYIKQVLTVAHHIQKFTMINVSRMVDAHPWHGLLQRIRQEELDSRVIKMIKHLPGHLPYIYIKSPSLKYLLIALPLLGIHHWNQFTTLSSTAKQQQGDVVLEKSPLASLDDWMPLELNL